MKRIMILKNEDLVSETRGISGLKPSIRHLEIDMDDIFILIKKVKLYVLKREQIKQVFLFA